MKLASLLPYAIGAVSIGAVLTAFSQSASPYVTVAEARKMSGDRLHLAGKLVPNTARQDVAKGTQEFDVLDKNGDVAHVVHKGERVSLSEATTVVAVGRFDGDHFASEQVLVKCPSRYEPKDGEPKDLKTSAPAKVAVK